MERKLQCGCIEKGYRMMVPRWSFGANEQGFAIGSGRITGHRHTIRRRRSVKIQLPSARHGHNAIALIARC